jgi:nitrate reductase NapA
MTRRELLKRMAAAAAVSAGQAVFPGIVFAAADTAAAADGIEWKKTPCRFCGVGCGLLVGVAKGRAVAVKGDPASPVNKGLCCVKGYHSVMALYGKDRLTQALVRKDGTLVPVPLKDALDLVAAKMGETIKAHGKDAVALYGSGQWTIPDGYVASKFMKGGIGTNNLEANARLCMASAVSGFMTSFGLDEPMGCYEDIDHADVFVLWGNNMAEMHPVLFSRLLDRRLRDPKVKIIDLATRWTRTSMAADRSILFAPQTDLALANAICHEIIKNGQVNQAFVEKHVSFHEGKTGIGYGLEDKFTFTDEARAIGFARYRELLAEYSPEKVERLSGVPAREIRYLASLYGDPGRKVMSFWCMGFNQHTRGTWINNLVYNIHLLTGKIATPGNSPFSLTGQPSACGTVREVGTLTNRPPHGEVTREKDRKLAAEIWGVPVERIPAKPTYHTVEMFRALDRGDIRFIWIQVTNPMVTMPRLRRYRDGALKDGRFVVVSDVYPTPTTDVADVVLPSALWIEREGMFGNSERRTQHFEKMLAPPGEAMSDGWQFRAVPRRRGPRRGGRLPGPAHVLRRRPDRGDPEVPLLAVPHVATPGDARRRRSEARPLGRRAPACSGHRDVVHDLPRVRQSRLTRHPPGDSRGVRRKLPGLCPVSCATGLGLGVGRTRQARRGVGASARGPRLSRLSRPAPPRVGDALARGGRRRRARRSPMTTDSGTGPGPGDAPARARPSRPVLRPGARTHRTRRVAERWVRERLRVRLGRRPRS